MASELLTLALDWTPNTNHSGFFVAAQKGFYAERGLDVKIEPPSDAYEKEETPARRVVKETADMCICPTESLISCWTSDEGCIKPIAVAAILQDDNSAIVTPKSTGITNPKDLDGKSYASYGGRFEMAIVQQLIKSDGGKGEALEVNPPKLNCFAEMMNGNAVATWVFMGWEGVEAKRNGHDLTAFKLSDYGIPYGYSPLLLVHPRFTQDGGATLKKFLAATADGYKYAAFNPQETVNILSSLGVLKLIGHNEHLDNDFLLESQTIVGKTYLNEDGMFGIMNQDRNSRFIDWLIETGSITNRAGELVSREALNVNKMFTNEFLPT